MSFSYMTQALFCLLKWEKKPGCCEYFNVGDGTGHSISKCFSLSPSLPTPTLPFTPFTFNITLSGPVTTPSQRVPLQREWFETPRRGGSKSEPPRARRSWYQLSNPSYITNEEKSESTPLHSLLKERLEVQYRAWFTEDKWNQGWHAKATLVVRDAWHGLS